MPVGTFGIFGRKVEKMVYHALLNDKIACEQNGTDFFCPSEDRRLLHKMFDEINHQTGSDIHYLAQIDSFIIPGAGRIVEKYILDFTSESVKCYLIPQMIADKITDCDKLLLQLYLHFRQSKEYISEPGQPAPAHIYVRYDNAFKTLRSRRIDFGLFLCSSQENHRKRIDNCCL
mgnify:CR=1 FL=1